MTSIDILSVCLIRRERKNRHSSVLVTSIFMLPSQLMTTILAVSKHQIVKYTMEGRRVISVECTEHGFHDPSGIAVHPSGKVIVAGSCIPSAKS